MKARAACAVVALAALGCGERDPSLDKGFDLMAPASIEDHVVFVDRQREQAHLVEVSGSAPEHTAVSLPAGPRSVEQRNDHPGELLVLGAGRVDDGENPAEPPTLSVVTKDGTDRIYDLGSPFNSFIQSEDGRRVFLFYDEGARQDVESLLFNQSEVAVVDLDAPPGSDNPVRRTLLSLGDVPRAVSFSPPMEVAGEMRELAVVSFDSDVAIWDLTNIDRPAYTVELSQDATASLGLRQVLFGRDEASIYLRGDSSDNVFAITLSSATSEFSNDFSPSVNPLGAGTAPADMALYDELATDAPSNEESTTQDGRSTRRLLVVSESTPTALVIDGTSSRVTTVPLPANANRIHLFEGGKLNDSTVQQRALLYRPGSNSVIFLDLEGLEDSGARKVEALGLRSSYGRVLSVSETLVLLIHDQQGLSLLDLEKRSVQPIQSSLNLLDAVANSGKLWLAPRGQDRVGFLDLEGYHPDEVRLDAAIEHVVTVPSERRPRFVTTHRSSIGYLTALDAEDPASLSKALSVRGFLVEDLFGGAR